MKMCSTVAKFAQIPEILCQLRQRKGRLVWSYLTSPPPLMGRPGPINTAQVSNLKARFPQHSEEAIRKALEDSGGHAGLASIALDKALEEKGADGSTAAEAAPASVSHFPLKPLLISRTSCVWYETAASTSEPTCKI